MINFKKYTLDNGLRVIVHQDSSTPMVAFNVLYNVGARDENPNRTGFAHLFEHLMFEGSVNIPNYDKPLQNAGGENNAFTNNNITNYYITIPKENVETAFWLESDRMLDLAFSEEKLEIQKKVVIEEFKQRYLNQPYGDWNLLLRPLVYKEHPYMWSTIGKEISHVEEASLDEVKDFFYNYYAPNNAILVVAGDVNYDEILALSEKWFGSIPSRKIAEKKYKQEPVQLEARKLEVEREVPVDAIYKAYHMPGRMQKDYHTCDLISDILSNGKSARLTQRLVKEQKIFSSVNAYITGDIDPGMFMVTGHLNEGVSFEQAEQAIEQELNNLQELAIDAYELEKVKNRVETALVFSEVSVLNKAMNLAFYELLGDAGMINSEIDKYAEVSIDDIKRMSAQLFNKNNCSSLYYHSK